MSSQLLFLFSVLGGVNGVFLALYFFTRRSNRLTHAMLGALLISVGFRTVKSTFYYFNPDLAIEFLQIGLAACLLIGPLTYLYVDSHLADLKASAANDRWRWHLLSASCIILIAVNFPYSQYPNAWFYYVCGIHGYWFAYLLLAGKKLWQSRAVLRDADGKLIRGNILLLSVYSGSFLLLAAYVTTPLTSYIVGALSFTFSVHVAILSWIVHHGAKAEVAKKEKYQNRKLTGQDAGELIESLNRVMREQQLYLNPNLSLALLAKKVGNLQTTVSQVINENLGKSFNLYINEFRIQHAQDLLISESRMNMGLVAECSGFNSTSTFFAAFKKTTGQTPASYRAARASASLPSCTDRTVGTPRRSLSGPLSGPWKYATQPKLRQPLPPIVSCSRPG
ncbi:helix-turn-helix domain-containing protein [Massilia arenae]|nr:helix-turn-helix domain-containing protein [Massilia arenae]